MSVRMNQVIRQSITPFEITKATVASLWKSGFMGDTFVRGRAQFEKFQRSVVGDLAKLSLKKWFEQNGLQVTDWDDVRNSWRSHRKPYDLSVNGHSIEVRSSISQHRTIGETLRSESIIHPCNVRVKEITVQVFFGNPSCEEAWLCGWALRADLESRRFRSVRRVGPRLVDFFLIPFNNRAARPMSRLVSHLRR